MDTHTTNKDLGVWKTNGLDHWIYSSNTTKWLLKGYSPLPDGECTKWKVIIVLNGKHFTSNIKGDLEELKQYVENEFGLV